MFNQYFRIMNKIELAQILEYVSTCKKREYYINIAYPSSWEKFGDEKGKAYFVESASGAAGTKLIKGRISLKRTYLVSRGKELPYQKPNAVAEYGEHWPHDFCYFYKI